MMDTPESIALLGGVAILALSIVVIAWALRPIKRKD